AASLPSEPMVPGAIQVPPSGLPVVFGPDHPTTGGYPVLAVVPRAGLDALAQAGPGLTVRFVTVPGSPRRGRRPSAAEAAASAGRRRRCHDVLMPRLLPDPAYFASLPKVISSGAVILRDEHDHLVIEKPNYRDHWLLPGGGVDAGEDARECAQRE